MKYIILYILLIIILFIYKLLSKQINEKFEEGFYRKTPFNFNSFNLIDSKDTGILKNIRPNFLVNTYSNDLDYKSLDFLLEKLKNEKIFYKQESVKFICQTIVDRINQLYFKFKLNNAFHPEDNRKYNLLDYEEILKKKKTKNIFQSVYNITFYKKLKDNGYTIQVGLENDKVIKLLKISNINIIGIDLNQKYLLTNEFISQKYCNFNNKNFKTSKCFNDIFLTDKEKNNFIKNLKMNTNLKINSLKETEFLKGKKKETQLNDEYIKNKCFGKNGFNESTCNSYSFENGKTGVWDKPCLKNEECPFYKKNKNYPNSRGGCKNGYCEFPLNIKRLSYKKYDKKIKPFCHNCKLKKCLGDDCYTCCDKQHYDKLKYNFLKSPDYIFQNDLNL